MPVQPGDRAASRRPPGAGRRAASRRMRARRTAVAALALAICAGTLIAGLTVGHRTTTRHPPRAAGHGISQPSGSAGQAGHAPANGHPALQVMAAPYQLPAPFSRAVALPDQRGLLIAGGLTAAHTTTDAVIRLNPVTGQTSPAGRLAVATHDAAGAMLNGRPVVFGGGSQASIADVQAGPAGPAGDMGAAPAGQASWTGAGQLPGPRSDLASAVAGGKAYLVGGYDGTGYDPDVLVTSDGRRFAVAAKLPVPVRYPAVAALGSQIWVFGGQTPAGITDAIQRVDLATGKAAVAGRLPSALAHATGMTVAGHIYVAGGQIASGPGLASPSAALTTSAQVLSFTPAGASGGQVRLAGQLPVPVADAPAAVWHGIGYLVGGEDNGRAVPTVSTLRPAPVAAATTSADSPWLGPAHDRGHLAPGSDPSALPADVLIADHLNNRLLIVDPQGRIRWQFPQPGDLAPGQTFQVPDDAFFSPDGRHIVATQEDDFVISVIDVAAHKIIYRYGTPGVPGSGPNHVNNPDDALLAPNGRLLFADIKNCRIVTVAPPAQRPLQIIGQTGSQCLHDPPHRFGSPNGAFPLTDGHYLVTEINGDWADEMSLNGEVSWSAHPPGVAYPSDTNEVYPGRYLTADYSNPGQVAEFTSSGRLLWRFGGLNQPSLALPLPNGNILVNDDFNHRVIVIDPVANRIVWQYGHTGVAGQGPGYLYDPDGVDLVPPESLLITHAATMGLPGGG